MKYAIFILVHHNPWLFNASLISLLSQTRQDYDLHFIYIKGNGEARDNLNYSDFYNIVDNDNQANAQLTPDDERILKFIKSLKMNYTFHEYPNDHGLDSGAWYRLIQSEVWKNYDYSFFLMEGFLFVNKNSIDSMLRISMAQGIDFMAMGHEKRFVGIDNISSIFGNRRKTKLEAFHEKKVNYIIDLFSKINGFKEIISNWPNQIKTKKLSTNFLGRTEYHVNYKKYTSYDFIKYYIKRIIRHKKIINLFSKKIFINNNGDLNLYNINEAVNECFKDSQLNYHKESSPYFFACMCQHMFSKQLLSSYSELLEKNDIYKKLDVPFSATGLEAIWGIMPNALKYEKWFTDAVHRPRKNYITLQREDNISRMCHYLNVYSNGILHAFPNNDFIDIIIKDSKYNYINNIISK